MPPPRSSVAAVRRGIIEQFRNVGRAWSVNGRDVVFTVDFDQGAEVGGFLTVTTPEGQRLLVQVHDLRLAVRDAVRVEVDTAELEIAGPALRGANVDVAVRLIEGDGAVLGVITAAGIERVPVTGFSEADVAVAAHDDVEALVTASLGSSVGLTLGRLGRADVEARLKASGFARHTFVCGQSGSGKTYSTGVLLERILLETELPLVVLDPNSDYVNLGHLRSRREINAGRRHPFSVEDHALLSARWAEQARVVVASARGGDVPLRVHLSDLTLEEQALVLGLHAVADADEYAAYASAVAALDRDRFGVADVEAVLLHRYDEPSRRVAQRIGNLGVGAWAVWADPAETSLAERPGEQRALVLDTGSLADARERSVVALALLGRLRRRPDRRALSIVIDEAHNVCGPDAATPLERAVADHAVWIAGEGRKFGLYLILATQRPQKVLRNVVSQCDNLLLMRVNSRTDLAELAEVFSHVPAAMIAEARSFQLGEVLAAGPVATPPIRLRVGERWTREGGADLPTTWASPSPSPSPVPRRSRGAK